MRDVRISTVNVRHDLHLIGGVRGGVLRSGALGLYPALGRDVVELPVTDTRAFVDATIAIGVELFGYEERWPEDETVWYLIESKRGLKYPSEIVWGHIARSARKAGNDEAAGIASHASFALRTAGLRLRDISREYRFQNSHAVRHKTRDGGKFDNLRSFDLQMNLHSLLADLCTAREHLACFAARYILDLGRTDWRMAQLAKRLDANPVDHPLADKLNAILNDDGGWMDQLVSYRNFISHQAPIEHLGDKYLRARHIAVENALVYRIEFRIPTHPKRPTEGQRVDAMERFRFLALKMRELAALIATWSPYKPEIPTISDCDVVRVTPLDRPAR